MSESVYYIQKKLIEAGYNIKADGVDGPQTRTAMNMHKLSQDSSYPPWLTELGKQFGLHEIRDKKALTEWLASDGGLLGDPEDFPWCGDAMQTAIRNTLPNEPFKGELGKNPYWARNWLLFGEKTNIALGALVVLGRPGGGGHIAAVVGFDSIRNRIRIRGGNQDNTVNDTWVDVERVLGYRKPTTWGFKLPNAPYMDSSKGRISRNEA